MLNPVIHNSLRKIIKKPDRFPKPVRFKNAVQRTPSEKQVQYDNIKNLYPVICNTLALKTFSNHKTMLRQA